MISFPLQYANEIKAEFPSEQEGTCFCYTATLSVQNQRLVVPEVVVAVVAVEVVAAVSVLAFLVATVKVFLGLGCSLFG